MLKEGDRAPDFELQNTNGKTVRMKDLLGNKIVFYFYPRDMTPGCTVESCEFRDFISEYEKLNVKVFGISRDDVTSHQKFTEKYDLNFPLLADIDKVLCKAYGVWGAKMFMGKPTIGRTTFVIDEKGIIIKVFEKVKPESHANEVLEFLTSFSNS